MTFSNVGYSSTSYPAHYLEVMKFNSIRWEKLEDAGYNMEFDYTEKRVILFISTALV